MLTSCRIADEQVEVVDEEDDEAITGGNETRVGDIVTQTQIQQGDGLEPVRGGQPWPMVKAADVYGVVVEV